ncbi:hypothetical protein BH20ACI4_BH20ACI4_00310 [soil metagenome]
MKERVYKLAIESGIGGGTVSIFEEQKFLDFRSCRHPATKADYLIEEISELLKTNKLEKTKISEIIYSESPGSHTGLKIGASIARGLQLALDTGVKSRNLFDSIFDNCSSNFADKILIVLPLSGADFVWRIYDAERSMIDSGRSSWVTNGTEVTNLENPSGLKILLPLHLFDNPERIYNKFGLESQCEIVDLGENLSGYLV